MAKKVAYICFLLFVLIPTILVKGQASGLTPDKQLLLLQLSLNYYTVVQEGRVDQDSSLLLVSRRNHISRWPVITEGFGNDLVQANNKWIDSRRTGEAVKELRGLHGIDHIKLLVLLGAYYAFQPGYHQKDRDSAQYFLSSAKRQGEALHSVFWVNQSLCLLGKNYYKANQVKEGSATFDALINTCQKNGDQLMEAKAWDYQGTYCPPSAATIMLKITSIKKANKFYQQISQQAKQINTLMNMAYLEVLMKYLNGAETHVLKALQMQGVMNFPYLHYSYDLMSLIFVLKGNDDKLLNYALKSVRSCLATKDSIGLPYFYARVALTQYGDKKAHSFSNIWYKKAVDEFTRNHDPAVYRSLANLVNNLNETGKSREAIKLLESTFKNIPPVDLVDRQMAFLALAKAYRNIKNYSQAERYYLMADHLSDQDNLITKDFRSAEIKLFTGEFYFEAKRFDKAKIYLLDFLSTPAPKMNELATSGQAHMLLYMIDSLHGNYESAIKHLRQYVNFNKRMVESNNAKSIASMQIQLEMTQKEKDMQILQAKSAIQSERANTIRKFIYAGIGAAVLIISMLYNRYYVNKKQKQELDKKNIQLNHAINEKDELLTSKEWLLKEVHHRVKNNLHTVICLLESQAAYLENDALKAVENSQHRIYAMSLIHQKLYQSDDIKTVDMSVYLPEFVRYLNESFGTTSQIRFELDIEPLKLGVSYAVPLSLIINETVTNSIKYAFPEFQNGIVTISLHEVNDKVELVIADNGIGMDTSKANTPSASLGLKLLRGLSEDIKADIEIQNNNGTIITLSFKKDELMHADFV
jgi:two-component sensor histidine kinase